MVWNTTFTIAKYPCISGARDSHVNFKREIKSCLYPTFTKLNQAGPNMQTLHRLPSSR